MMNMRKDLCSRLIYSLFFTLIISVFFTGYSQAVVRTVTNLNDNGPGSLRDIIDNVAQAGDDIVFDASLAGGTINLTTGPYIIGIDLTITGPADNPITIDANNLSRIFTLFVDVPMDGANIVLSNLVIANGFVSGTMNESGGAIGATSFPFANLEVNDCTFRNNSVECSGTSCQARAGAIVVVGRLTIRRSTFDGNTTHCSINNQFCFASAGAIEHGGALPLVLENNTFCNNEVSCLGTGNSTCGLEGGALVIDNNSTSTFNNNTFSDNNIDCNSNTCNVLGSSIFADSNIDMLNTIIDNDPGVAVPNCEGTIIDGGNNLQFPGSSCGGTIATANAMLGPLADNGGITQTKAIPQSSPAFNGGNNATCEATDQRGVPRPQAVICDIGAYELIPTQAQTQIPTLSEWGLIAMAGILGIFGLLAIRRRKAIG